MFAPNGHAKGWSLHTAERVRLEPNDSCVITLIDNEMYIHINGNHSGFHWECFSPVFSK
jgi:hypothetical protein